MENLKRHLKNHTNSYNCPECKYSSPRKDTLKRHSKTHRRQVNLLSNLDPLETPEKTRLEPKLYHTDPTDMNSYIYQQSLPKNKEIFLWILHESDNQPKNSRPYYQLEPIIIPLEANDSLQDPRPHPEANELSQDPEPSLSEEIAHLLNQEYAFSASLSELDMILRNLESEDTNREEETYASEDIWKLIDSI